jgi:dTDP-4-amino-4,6-dideoxygalactose transaminase
MIQIFSNTLGKEELDAVAKVFKSRWTGSGPMLKEFEQKFAKKIGSKHILVYNSATSATFSAVEILGIKKGDEVIIPSVNFIGCANAVIKVGAKPVFCDVDPDYFHVTPEEIEDKRTENTKALIPLHYGGHPIDFDAVSGACDGMVILEDSANSPLSKYGGRNCGTLGDAGVFSFDAMKFISIGNGGALAVQDDGLHEKAIENRYFGLPPKTSSGIDRLAEGNQRWWEIKLSSISGRHISNDILGAIALEQLKKVDSFVERRKEIWGIYKQELEGLPWLDLPPEPRRNTTSSYYLFWVKVSGGKRDKFARFMVKNDIYVTFRYFPLHLIEYYRKHHGANVSLPNAEEINESTINLPLHQNLSDEDVNKIVSTVKKFGKMEF